MMRDAITSNTTTVSSPVPARSGANALSKDEAYANPAARSARNEKLTGVFAHEFNNILSAMLLRLELLRQDSGLSGTAKEDIRELEAETSRARFLTRYLMTLNGHQRTSKPGAMDLTKLMKKVLTRLGPLIGRGAAFQFEPAPEKIWIFAETSSMEDLMTNLCLHSPHAALRDGELVLKTHVVCLEANEGSCTGNFVCLSLTETWRYIEMAELADDESKRYERALLPLEEFARQNNGWVEAAHDGQNGFTIRIFLPTTEPGPDTSHDPELEETCACSETILLVEDELALRRVTALTLRKRGYAVLEAGDEAEALRVWEKHHGKIDLVLTDMVMPGSRVGSELAKKMRGKNEALKVMVASGYGISDEERADFERENITFLTKPYDAAEVAKMVRECLDRDFRLAD